MRKKHIQWNDICSVWALRIDWIAVSLTQPSALLCINNIAGVYMYMVCAVHKYQCTFFWNGMESRNSMFTAFMYKFNSSSISTSIFRHLRIFTKLQNCCRFKIMNGSEWLFVNINIEILWSEGQAIGGLLLLNNSRRSCWQPYESMQISFLPDVIQRISWSNKIKWKIIMSSMSEFKSGTSLLWKPQLQYILLASTVHVACFNFCSIIHCVCLVQVFVLTISSGSSFGRIYITMLVFATKILEICL